jgi:hypothetical protein
LLKLLGRESNCPSVLERGLGRKEKEGEGGRRREGRKEGRREERREEGREGGMEGGGRNEEGKEREEGKGR